MTKILIANDDKDTQNTIQRIIEAQFRDAEYIKTDKLTTVKRKISQEEFDLIIIPENFDEKFNGGNEIIRQARSDNSPNQNTVIIGIPSPNSEGRAMQEAGANFIANISNYHRSVNPLEQLQEASVAALNLIQAQRTGSDDLPPKGMVR